MPVLLTLARSTLAMDPDLSEKLVGPRPWIGCTLRGSGWHGRVGAAPALLGRGSTAPPWGSGWHGPGGARLRTHMNIHVGIPAHNYRNAPSPTCRPGAGSGIPPTQLDKHSCLS